jgi:hypothetical protein
MNNTPESRLAAAVLTQAAEDFINPELEGEFSKKVRLSHQHKLRKEALQFLQGNSRWHELAEFEFTETRFGALLDQAVKLQPL